MKDTDTIEISTFDPLLHNLPLPLRATLYPLGFPLRHPHQQSGNSGDGGGELGSLSTEVCQAAH